MKTSTYWGGLALSLTLTLAACGGGSGDEDRHDADTIDTAGRLAIAEDAATALRIYDLDSSSVVSSFALANAPTAVYASPGRRYALAFQRAQDTVQVTDGGVWQENHGDHLHDYKQAPKLLSLRINGPQPTHYDDRPGQASIYMDGRASPLQVASATVFNDADLTAGRTGTSVSFARNMHGFAEPNGNFLVATYRAAEASGPTQVEIYGRQGAQYSFVRRLDTQCPSMHGSFTRASTTITGCADGVLVVSPQAAGDAAAVRIPTATGIGTIAGHPDLPRVIGLGNAGTPSTTRFYEIDLAAGTSSPITIAGWAEGRLRRAHGFDRDGRYFFVLDDLGTLHVLERGASGWATRTTIAGAIPSMPATAPFPAFVANEARDEIYLSDPSARQLVVVNTASQSLARRINLDFRPTYLAWLGIAR